MKKRSGTQLSHDKRDIPAFDTVLFHSNLSSLPPKYLSDILTDKIVLSCGPKISKRPLLIPYWWLQNKKENFISGSSRGDFWQPLIAPEARKKRPCQSYSASHIGPRADCPFHRPAAPSTLSSLWSRTHWANFCLFCEKICHQFAETSAPGDF